MATRYLEAQQVLEHAARDALAAGDFDTLARVHMPLQESARQARLRSGEGIVRFDAIAAGPGALPSATELLEQTPHGQLIVAGWGELTPSIEFNHLARLQRKYAQTFLAAAFPVAGGEVAVVLTPTADVALPTPTPRPIDELIRWLPPHAILLNRRDLPDQPQQGTVQTFARMAAWWEALHSPFLAQARAVADPRPRIDALNRVLSVDDACELAHQELSAAARALARQH